MFKVFTLSCLLAVSVQCVPAPNPAVPYYPQPYPAAYPQVYPAQPKYNVQPAFVAPYAPASYRQVLVPANPAYNAYYYGYNPYPAYPQQYNPYPYVQNDGTTAPAAPAPSGWGEYLNSIWNYVPNYPFGGSAASESESSQAESSATSSAESSAVSETASPGKGDKPAEGQKTEAPKAEPQPAGNDQTAAPQAPFKPFGPAPFVYLGQPQFYGQLPYQQALYDPSKLNAANNGAVSSYLFYRNQPQPVPYQQPQQFADQKYFQAPSPQSYQGTAALAYQRYLQNQKPFVQGQYQQQQAFQPQQQDFQQQQQYDQQPQQDEPSVVVDSNSPAVQVNAEGQQKSQSKLATGSN